MYKELFSIMDCNNDNVLEIKEFRNFMNAAFDIHGVLKTEKHPSFDKFYSMLDTNNDGKL